MSDRQRPAGHQGVPSGGLKKNTRANELGKGMGAVGVSYHIQDKTEKPSSQRKRRLVSHVPGMQPEGAGGTELSSAEDKHPSTPSPASAIGCRKGREGPGTALGTKDPSPLQAAVLLRDCPRLGPSLTRAGRFLGSDQGRKLQGLLSSVDRSAPQNNPWVYSST